MSDSPQARSIAEGPQLQFSAFATRSQLGDGACPSHLKVKTLTNRSVSMPTRLTHGFQTSLPSSELCTRSSGRTISLSRRPKRVVTHLSSSTSQGSPVKGMGRIPESHVRVASHPPYDPPHRPQINPLVESQNAASQERLSA